MKMTVMQKITLGLGCTGIVLNIIGLITGSAPLNYSASFLGRLSGAFYMVSVDKFRFEYLLPITLSALNIAVTSESLLFTELLVTSGIYQLNAFRLFSRKS